MCFYCKTDGAVGYKTKSWDTVYFLTSTFLNYQMKYIFLTHSKGGAGCRNTCIMHVHMFLAADERSALTHNL